MPKTTTRRSATKRPKVLAPKGNGVLKTVLPNGLTAQNDTKLLCYASAVQTIDRTDILYVSAS